MSGRKGEVTLPVETWAARSSVIPIWSSYDQRHRDAFLHRTREGKFLVRWLMASVILEPWQRITGYPRR